VNLSGGQKARGKFTHDQYFGITDRNRSVTGSGCIFSSIHSPSGRCPLRRLDFTNTTFIQYPSLLSNFAVDAHTAHHLYYECLKGELLKDRTVILVSHHVQLCTPGAKFIVALDNGRVQFSGDQEHFQSSGVMNTLVQSGNADVAEDKEGVALDVAAAQEKAVSDTEPNSETSSTIAAFDIKEEKKAPRKLVEEEKRAVGRIGRDIWETYIRACGDVRYWSLFIAALVLAALIPVAENGWLE
jgi:hypothetical protein